jgi:hypothetical protein
MPEAEVKRATPARKASPRKAAPRKKAATRADGGANGEALVVAPPSPEENGASEPVQIDKAALHGYPKGTPLYCYDGPGGEIVFPHISTVQVDPVFFYDIYELPEMFQTFEWMKKANVPHGIGRMVMALPVGTRREFMGGWFQGMKERPPDPTMTGGLPPESSSSPAASSSTGEPSAET